MGISVKWGLGDYKSSDYTQQELRSKFRGSTQSLYWQDQNFIPTAQVSGHPF